MSERIDKAIQKMVIDGPIPVEELAERLGKTPKTLMREVDPSDKKAKLGAETLIEIMKITGEVTPLKLMAEEFNCDLEES